MTGPESSFEKIIDEESASRTADMINDVVERYAKLRR